MEDPTIRVSQASHQGDQGATEGHCLRGSSLSEQEPTLHDSSLLPTPSSQNSKPRRTQLLQRGAPCVAADSSQPQTGTGTGCRGWSRLCSHSELPSGDVSPQHLWGVIRVRPQSWGSQWSLGCYDHTDTRQVAQGGNTGTPLQPSNANSLSGQVETEMTRDRPHRLANLLQCVVTRNLSTPPHATP